MMIIYLVSRWWFQPKLLFMPRHNNKDFYRHREILCGLTIFFLFLRGLLRGFPFMFLSFVFHPQKKADGFQYRF